ncbi:hypothetical protein FRC03_005299 [Tulasnella sp. 419]|nr:hypothetical protein FRC03_005299 [Tulasnella sp. 419]
MLWLNLKVYVKSVAAMLSLLSLVLTCRENIAYHKRIASGGTHVPNGDNVVTEAPLPQIDDTIFMDSDQELTHTTSDFFYPVRHPDGEIVNIPVGTGPSPPPVSSFIGSHAFMTWIPVIITSLLT